MSKPLQADVVIAGGGLIGLSIAHALAVQGVSSVVVEAQDPENWKDPAFDGRTSAIALGTRQYFESINLWQAMAPHATAINDIHIVEGHSPRFLHYDHQDVGREPMGHIIENRHLRTALVESLDGQQNIQFLAPCRYQTVDTDVKGVTVGLEDGREVQGQLLICAEGKFSKLRQEIGIGTIERDYKQTAIVAAVDHEKPHNGMAVERFLPSGPFAILPMAGGNRSSIVWTEETASAQQYLDITDAAFLQAIEERFGDRYGKLSLVEGRFSYPLTLIVAKEYYRQRLALVGDAAHGIHPIAGQGFNLGMRDVIALTTLIAERKACGLDVGSQTMLKTYQKQRKPDNWAMIAATDSLNRLFSNDLPPIRLARKLGLGGVQHLPPVKKAFMRHAMGLPAFSGKRPMLPRKTGSH